MVTADAVANKLSSRLPTTNAAVPHCYMNFTGFQFVRV